MQHDFAPGRRKPFFDDVSLVIAGVVDEDVDEAHRGMRALRAPSDCRHRLRFEPNSADPSRSFPRAANPPCRHRKALSLCFGLSISWSGKRNFAG